MARTVAVFAACGFLLGGLGAVGWHFQPVFEALGAPRPFSQLYQAFAETTGGVPSYSGVVPYEALSWWHEPSGVPVATLMAFGVIVGATVGALLSGARRRAVSTESAPGPAPTLVGALLLGVLVGGGSALVWHWDPTGSAGLWNGVWFWPVDVLYPLAGAVLCLATAAVIERRRRSGQG